MIVDEFSLLIQDVIVCDPVRSRMLARKLGKKPESLLKEVSPDDHRAKLGVETLLQVMELSGDIRPLEYMAQCFGLSLALEKHSRRKVRGVQPGGQ